MSMQKQDSVVLEPRSAQQYESTPRVGVRVFECLYCSKAHRAYWVSSKRGGNWEIAENGSV